MSSASPQMATRVPHWRLLKHTIFWGLERTLELLSERWVGLCPVLVATAGYIVVVLSGDPWVGSPIRSKTMDLVLSGFVLHCGAGWWWESRNREVSDALMNCHEHAVRLGGYAIVGAGLAYRTRRVAVVGSKGAADVPSYPRAWPALLGAAPSPEELLDGALGALGVEVVAFRWQNVAAVVSLPSRYLGRQDKTQTNIWEQSVMIRGKSAVPRRLVLVDGEDSGHGAIRAAMRLLDEDPTLDACLVAAADVNGAAATWLVRSGIQCEHPVLLSASTDGMAVVDPELRDLEGPVPEGNSIHPPTAVVFNLWGRGVSAGGAESVRPQSPTQPQPGLVTPGHQVGDLGAANQVAHLVRAADVAEQQSGSTVLLSDGEEGFLVSNKGGLSRPRTRGAWPW